MSNASIAKVIEITAQSSRSFDDAIKSGLERATQSLDKVKGCWIKDQSIQFENGQVKSYRVDLKVTFELGQKTSAS